MDNKFVIAAAIIFSGDLGLPSVSLTFAPSSGDGAEMCASVIILSDRVVEDVKVMLALVTTGESISIGNGVATIIITGTYNNAGHMTFDWFKSNMLLQWNLPV